MSNPICGIDFEATHYDNSRGWAWQWGLSFWDRSSDGDWINLWNDEGLIGPPLHYKTGKVTRDVNMASLDVAGDPADIWNRLKDRDHKADVAALSEALRRVYPAKLIAYNAAFDMEALNNLALTAGEYNRSEGEFLPMPMPISGTWLDVQAQARRKWPSRRNRLDDVLARLGHSRSTNLHSAAEDAGLAVLASLSLAGALQIPSGATPDPFADE